MLRLDDRDVALHLGHQDGGEVVRKLNGHADERLAWRSRAFGVSSSGARSVALVAQAY